MVLIVFQFSSIQTYTAKEALELLAKKTNHELSLTKVRVAWLDKAELIDFLVKDIHDDTLIYADRITVNYRLIDLISGDYFSFEEVLVETAIFNLVRHHPGEDLNIKYFIDSLRDPGKESTSGNPIEIDHIESVDLKLLIDDKTKVKKKGQVDFSNIDFSINNLNLFDFELRSDTIIGDLKHFTGIDKLSGFEIERLETDFRLCSQSLSLDDLDFQTETSSISDSLEFFFNGLDDFAHFSDSVSFVFHFDQSVISREDFQLLTGLGQMKSNINLDGIFWGMVGDFNIEDSQVGFGSNSFFRGGVSCFGLPDLDNTFILADITSSRLDPTDLVPYVGDLSENLRQMGRIDFMGSFAGFPKDFVAKGDFITDQGAVYSDIHIEFPSDAENITYDGNLEFESVNVGSFLKNEIIQSVNLKTKIKGKGLSPSTAEFLVETRIFNSELNGYKYDSINIEGRFAKNFFSGSLSVNDPNCKMKGDAQIDLGLEKEKLDINLRVDSIFFNRLRLSNDSLSASGNIDLKVSGFDFDRFEGRLEIDSSRVNYNGRTVVLDSITFEAMYEVDSSRKMNLAMPGLNAVIDGDFKITDVVKDVPVMVDGYLQKLQLKADSAKIEGSKTQYKLDVQVNIEDISSYLDSLRLPLKIFNHAEFVGSFRQSKSSNLSLYFSSDSVRFKNTTFHFPTIEADGFLDTTAREVLTSFIVESPKQKVVGIPETRNLFLEGIWFGGQIDLTTSIEQPSSKTDLRLETGFTIYKDSIVTHVKPSFIYILDDRWKFNPSNKIVIKDEFIKLTNLEIFDSSESIHLEGFLSDSTEVMILVEDLKMNKANLFTEIDLGGYLNGNFRIFRKNPREGFRFDGGFFLKNLQYANVLLGDLTGNSRWDPFNSSIYSEISVSRENFKSIDVKGYYFPTNPANQLAFKANFNDAQLVMASPFLKENFSEISGTADGEITFSGKLNSPKTDGVVTIKNGSGRINYLNTRYVLNGDIALSTNKISLDTVTIEDRKGNKAFASGEVLHDAFSNIRLNLGIAADNFEFLNTTYLDNELYYGSAYGSSDDIKVTGPLNDLLIGGEVKTEAGTRFFIPVSESTDGSQKEFIQFVSLLDSSRTEDVQDNFQLKGLTLDFDLEVTPEAYCELIFDVKKGDIIRGRGRGNLKLTLNTDGEFSMFGGLEITEGNYNFTFSNLINKEFEVIPGGRITWYGDPYDASLDLEATYLQRASLEELKNPEDRVEDLLSRKIPFLAVIELPGTILSPEPKFDIKAQNEGDLQQSDIGLLEQIDTDEEVNKQFVSLLFLKKFTPISSFLSGGGTNLAGNVSEILSNQVSYLFSQIDENLEVELDLADLDQEAFNTFQLRLAYTFLDGRLKVTSGGNFGNSNTAEENSINEIVGDWSVEYSLTRDGRLRVKAFRNANQLITSDQQSFERGVSLKFVDSFDQIKDILQMRREAAIRRKEDEGDGSEGAGNYPNPIP